MSVCRGGQYGVPPLKSDVSITEFQGRDTTTLKTAVCTDLKRDMVVISCVNVCSVI
jgi:hypothetical protein